MNDDVRIVDPGSVPATGDKVMLANATGENGMVLCPACQKGSTWKEGEDMKTRGPMQYLTVPGRGKALVHRSCIPMMLQLMFPAPVPQPAEKTVQSSITITPVADKATEAFPTSTCGHFTDGKCAMDKTDCDGQCGAHAQRAADQK